MRDAREGAVGEEEAGEEKEDVWREVPGSVL